MNSDDDRLIEPFSDEYFMKEALKQAFQAAEEDEVPIGAVVVAGNRVIGRGYNQVEKLNDPTAHAEMLAITAATQHLGSKFLEDCTLYVTIEPCAMCAGAASWSRIERIVYGAPEPKFGYSTRGVGILNNKQQVESGLMKDEAALLMTNFFRSKRKS